jgi:hypothetical protein
MSRAPDITLPDDIRSEPTDPRVKSFHDDPVLIVMQWTDELRGPISTGDEDLVGYTPEAIEAHNSRYKTWLDTLLGHIACGRYVAVRGWRPDATTSWDVPSVSKFKGSVTQQIQYQGKVHHSNKLLSFIHILSFRCTDACQNLSRRRARFNAHIRPSTSVYREGHKRSG